MSNSPISIPEILKNLSIAELNPMQKASLEASKRSQDLIILSATGSGKTLAFLLPLLPRLDTAKEGVQAIVLVPSRELALQIEQVFRSLRSGFKVNSCYGGHAMSVEKNNLSEPPAVLIGTPGRVGDHISRGNFDTASVSNLILDEFDKSLELGFHQEMSFITQRLEHLTHRTLTSATDLQSIPEFVGMQDEQKLNFLTGVSSRLALKTVYSEAPDKVKTFYSLLCNLEAAPTIVFGNHREAVERISSFLDDKEVENVYFHGGLEQVDRERILCKFRNGSSNILITTDLAARGLDIPDIKYVIHYQMPPKEDAFIHRNGRTARVDAKGTSFMVLSRDEKRPDYLPEDEEIFTPLEGKRNPELPKYSTLYIGAGKKDKINKMDIVGFLSKVGELEKNDLGLIEVKDFFAYAAVKRSKLSTVLSKVRDQKIKGKKVKIQLSK